MITLFIGRFQPFHLGHLHDIKEAVEFSDKVIIGIGSSQESNTSDNPFSFDERKEMINRVIKKENIKSDITILSIPDVNDDSKWVEHVVSVVGNFDVAYTGNDWVKKLFLKQGLKVKDVTLLKDINATEIRKRIDKSGNWQKLVPREVEEYIHRIDGVNRIKQINGIL